MNRHHYEKKKASHTMGENICDTCISGKELIFRLCKQLPMISNKNSNPPKNVQKPIGTSEWKINYWQEVLNILVIREM